MTVTYTKLNLRGIFDHYTVEKNSYQKDGETIEYYKPKIVLRNVTDLDNNTHYGKLSLNFGTAFKQFGLLDERAALPAMFEFCVRKQADGTINYPTNVTKVDQTYRPVPELEDNLLSGFIMQRNKQLGRHDIFDPDTVDAFKAQQPED